MRKFSYITVGTILNELKGENTPIARVTFYRLEKRLKFPVHKTTGQLPWRVYTRKEAEKIKNIIKENYNIKPSKIIGWMKPKTYTCQCKHSKSAIAEFGLVCLKCGKYKDKGVK